MHSPRSEAKKPQAAKSAPAASARAAKQAATAVKSTAGKNGALDKAKLPPKSRPVALAKPTGGKATATRASKVAPKVNPSKPNNKAPAAKSAVLSNPAAARSSKAPLLKPAAPNAAKPTAAKPTAAKAPATKAPATKAPATEAPAVVSNGTKVRSPSRELAGKPVGKTVPIAPAAAKGRSAAAAAAPRRPSAPAEPNQTKAEASGKHSRRSIDGAAAETPSAPPPKKVARKSIKEAAGVSTDAVARRTGKNWDDWFEVLDSAGAATLDQRGIIAILAQKHGIGPWWQQMIAVGYESLRGKSDKPPAADGFQINSSCTLEAPLSRVFRLWNDASERARWLSDDRFVVRGSSGEKTIRARWGKGTSHVAVSFAEKSGRTQVSVDHLQIESRDAAEQMKAYWAKKLGLLDQALAPRR